MQSMSDLNQTQATHQQGQNGGFGLLNDSDGLVELKYRSVENVATAKLAQGLAYFSLGLGLAEALMPKMLGQLAGVSEGYRKALPALGARELASGVAIMRSTKPTGAVWSRVVGDAIDLAFLGACFADDKSNKKRLVGATAAVLGVTALDVICAKKLSHNWSETAGNPKAPTTVGQTSARY